MSPAIPHRAIPAFERASRAPVSRIAAARVIIAAHARHFVMLDHPAFRFAALDACLAGHHAGRGGR